MTQQNAIIHPVTGCRVDTLFGIWHCPVEKLESWVNASLLIIERGELKSYQERSGQMQQESDAKPYTIDNNGIATMHVSGPITKYQTSFQSLFGGTSTNHLREVSRMLMSDTRVEGVYIDADSWGGTMEGTNSLGIAFEKLAKCKPVVCHSEDKATSGMLWLASSCPRFTCGKTAVIGSLGTVLQLMDISKLMEKDGKRPVVISAGKYKAIGAVGTEITEQDQKELQRFVDSANAQFEHQVSSKRNISKEHLEEVLTARVFVGEDAKRVELVDAVCNADEAYEQLVISIKDKTYSSGSVARGPDPTNPSPTTIRSSIMLSTAQLTQARELTGNAELTQETAAVALLTSLVAKTTEVQTQAGTIRTLETKVPKVLDTDVAKQRAALMVERIGLMVEQQAIVPAQAEILKKIFINGETVNAVMVTAGADGKYPYEGFIEAFKMNKPNGVVQQQAGLQPQPREIPGDPASGTVTAPTKERMNELRMHAGINPVN